MVYALNLERSTLSAQKELVTNNLLAHLVSSRIRTFLETDQIDLKCACFCLKIVDGPSVGELHSPVIISVNHNQNSIIKW